ncbi:MAG: lysozyme [Sphingopyxis sp.]
MSAVSAAMLVRKWEGFRSKPYLCPAGVPTIGYGFTRYPDGRAVTLADPAIDRDHADRVLVWLVENRYEPAARRLCPTATGPVLVAVVDFLYNLGASNFKASTLRRKMLARDWNGARPELLRWIRAGGRVLRGLVLRRTDEAALLPTGDGP